MIIPTEPIGSIPRPLPLVAALAKTDCDDPALDPLYEEAIRDTIARFEATGSPVTTDGEQRKYHNFGTYCVDLAAALKLAEQEMPVAPIDLVMSDLGLPDGIGLDLMRQLSSKYGLPGIALSGFGMDSDLAQSSAAGFSRHLIKPIDIAVLRATLAEMSSGA
jgi:CheY-like chemotaxis protein